jgi:hypothetical protein
MRVLLTLIIALWLCNSQPLNQLHYIKSFPIKTEDGCSFFSDSEDSLTGKKYLLVITGRHIAYMQLKNDKFLYFSKVKRIKDGAGYKDIYRGKAGSFELTIKSIKKTGPFVTQRNGVLYLKTGRLKEIIPVYGMVEENDNYNHK